MRSFTFCHAADLHIDSPFRGVVSEAPAVANALHASTFRAFEMLVEACLEREVDFLLVAGDVYDGQDRSVLAQMRFRDGLLRLAKAGISSYVVHGNHDPLDGRISSIDWPTGVHFFGKKLESVDVMVSGEPIARISGISFPTRKVTRNLAKDFQHVETELFQIGLLHCNVGSDTGHDSYAPCELQDLLDVGMDFWALGHVHTRDVLHRDPFIVYPGNIQGRSIREQGPRGCYFVEVDASGEVDLEFHTLDVVRWSQGQVAIDELETIDQLEKAIADEVEHLSQTADGRGLVCRISVEGRGALYRELRSPDMEEQLGNRLREQFSHRDPFAWLQQLQIACRPEVDLSERATRGDLLAEVLTVAQEFAKSDEAMEELYTSALTACWEHTGVKSALTKPTSEELTAFLTEAQLLSLDLLEDGP